MSGSRAHLAASILCVGLVVLLVAPPGVRAESIVFETNTVVDAGNTTYEGYDVTVRGCTVTINGAHTFNSLTIERNASKVGGVVRHAAAFEPGMDLTVMTNVVIQGAEGSLVASAIDVSGVGYSGSSGPGKGTDADGGAGGAGHGGAGGVGYVASGAGGVVYDALTAPVELGSGGGRELHYNNAGGAGGGAVRLSVGGTLTIDGAVRANGNSGANNGGGGGSGGSLYLTAATLAGSGTISANGGNGIGSGSWYTGGGGAGGRVAIYVCNMLFPTARITATGGTGHRPGGAGTIHQACLCGLPTDLVATPAMLCSRGASSQLTATSGGGGEVEWFTDTCGGTPVPGGPSPAVSPQTTTTYYARTKGGSGCSGNACAMVTITVNAHVAADFDGNCSVDMADLAVFSACASGPSVPRSDRPECEAADFDRDGDVDQDDFGWFQRCYSGTGPADAACER